MYDPLDPYSPDDSYNAPIGPPSPYAQPGATPGFQPQGSALQRLLDFQKKRPGFWQRVGLGGGVNFAMPDEAGAENRGANTIRAILRGLESGVNGLARGRAKEYAGNESDLKEGAKLEAQGNREAAMEQLRNRAWAETIRYHDSTNADRGVDNERLQAIFENLTRHQGVTEGFGGERIAEKARQDAWVRAHGDRTAGIADFNAHKPRGSAGGSRAGGPDDYRVKKAVFEKGMAANNQKLAAAQRDAFGGPRKGETPDDYAQRKPQALARYLALKRDYERKSALWQNYLGGQGSASATQADPLGIR